MKRNRVPDSTELIEAVWSAPAGVRAVVTTRKGGVSEPPFASFNLAEHVGDARQAVHANRQRLRKLLNLEGQPCWLAQVHGAEVVMAGNYVEPPVADASISRERGRVCAVLTADCLPVLLCNRTGNCVAAAHAGWRGLAAGVIEATLAAMETSADEVLAWLGPAIGPAAYEVGDEVRARFIEADEHSAAAFQANERGRWQADLYALASIRLRAADVSNITRFRHCTYAEPERFYSHRRDGRCGRMAALIWLER
ncbi:MAG: peptidoglycan editing factor PgeF [Gammaproteobacteria bacterium]|nr:peptidoglycan editing factor PgeF [Gammaproteobacteria bacterium]